MQRFFRTTMLLMFLFSTTSHAGINLEENSGTIRSFDSLKGRWVIINYWASWCTPCLEEIAAFNQFYTQHQNKDAFVFGVNYEALSPEKLAALSKELKILYPQLQKDPKAALQLGDIEGVPMTFVFNPEGKLTKTLRGPQSLKQLNQLLAP